MKYSVVGAVEVGLRPADWSLLILGTVMAPIVVGRALYWILFTRLTTRKIVIDAAVDLVEGFDWRLKLSDIEEIHCDTPFPGYYNHGAGFPSLILVGTFGSRRIWFFNKAKALEVSNRLKKGPHLPPVLP